METYAGHEYAPPPVAPQEQPNYGATISEIPPFITQIWDGQVQAPTGTPTPTPYPVVPTLVSELTEGQPQAPTTPTLVSELTEGQPQAPETPTLVSELIEILLARG